jgi:hypothetical protein
MTIVEIGIGFMVLLAGRPAYWTFVGGIAFLIGEYISSKLVIFSPTWNGLILSLLFAVIGAGLTFLFHRWTARVAGFIAGGFLIYNLPAALGAQPSWSTPLFFVVAGVAALIFLLISFDFGLVAISSLVAATMILRSLQFEGLDQGVMFFILVLLSLITQYLVMQYARPSPD